MNEKTKNTLNFAYDHIIKYANELYQNALDAINLESNMNPVNISCKIKELNKFPELGRLMRDVDIERKTDVLESWFTECGKLHDENKIIMENNKKLLDIAINFMTSLGLNQSILAQVTKRKREWRDAAWLSQLKVQVPTDDKWQNIEWEHNRELAKINDEIKKNEAIEKQKQKEAEIRQKSIDRERAIAVLCAKYCLGITSSAEDVLDHILSLNKYLRLAHYLQLNCGDWSEGFDYAMSGIDKFDVDSEIDAKIFNDITETIKTNEEEPDGRVFRDCEYNYTRLFEIVKKDQPDLLNDYTTCTNWIDFVSLRSRYFFIN